MKKLIHILLLAALFVLPLSLGLQTKRALLIGISNCSSNATKQWPDTHGANGVALPAVTLASQRFNIAAIGNSYINRLLRMAYFLQ